MVRLRVRKVPRTTSMGLEAEMMAAGTMPETTLSTAVSSTTAAMLAAEASPKMEKS